jgi:predicted FMN-binding regulatory protein PaiB
VCKWKLSQTRSLEDRLGVVEGLPREDGLHGSRLAELMRDVEPP